MSFMTNFQKRGALVSQHHEQTVGQSRFSGKRSVRNQIKFTDPLSNT
jgi:hypothetical protein